MIHRVFDIETVPLASWTPATEGAFPPVTAHRMVALACADIDIAPAPGGAIVRVLNLQGAHCGTEAGEAALLQNWGASMAATKPILVSWNGRKFDGPVMAMRAMKHQLNWSWWFNNSPDYRYRFGASHMDLFDLVGDFGGNGGKLVDAAQLLGLPGKDGMDGSMVAAEAAAGQFGRIAQYCIGDVVLTASVFLHYQALRGAITYAAAQLAITQLTALRAPPKGY